jgi:RNA polymerase sigma factor (sigma-70 family)
VPATDTSAFVSTATRLATVELPTGTASREVDGEWRDFTDVPRLTQALRKGEPGAFRFLHAQWNQRIQRYCFALAAGDDAFAMEIVQATYLRIFKQVPRAVDEAALWSWIAVAMRSAAIDLRRVGGRYRRALSRFADWLRFGAGRESVRSDETRLFAALDQALSKLEPGERELINRRYFEREPLESIAARCATTARAIEGRLARIRARLRAAMASTLREEKL